MIGLYASLATRGSDLSFRSSAPRLGLDVFASTPEPPDAGTARE